MPVIIILRDLIIIVIIIVTLLNGNVPESNYCIITIFVELYVMHGLLLIGRLARGKQFEIALSPGYQNELNSMN